MVSVTKVFKAWKEGFEKGLEPASKVFNRRFHVRVQVR